MIRRAECRGSMLIGAGMYHCEQCDQDVDHLVEGLCSGCVNRNYQEFLLFEAKLRWWDRLTPAERDKLIKEAHR